MGIYIASQPDKDLEGYFEHFAMDFESVNMLLKQSECDLSPYLFCPESAQDEAQMRDDGDSEKDIAYMKLITSEDYFPISEVASKITKAIALAEDYEEDDFCAGKEAFISDLEEISAELSKNIEDDIKVLFGRG